VGRQLYQGLVLLRQCVASLDALAAVPGGAAVALPNPFPKDFRVVDVLGAGTFGKVYLAEDLHLGCMRALKTLHADAPPASWAALKTDATRLAAVRHPNVVQVHAWLEVAGQPWLVLQF